MVHELPLRAEHLPKRKPWPEIMNLSLSLDRMEFVPSGAVLLYLNVGTINGERPSDYPTQFIASVVMQAHHVRALQVNTMQTAVEQQQMAGGQQAMSLLGEVKLLAEAAQEASVVASQAALVEGQAIRRLMDVLKPSKPTPTLR